MEWKRRASLIEQRDRLLIADGKHLDHLLSYGVLSGWISAPSVSLDSYDEKQNDETAK